MGNDSPNSVATSSSAGGTGADAVLKALLLTDLVGSTRLTEDLGDRRASAVFERHDRLARELLVEFEGIEIDKTDGFLLIFERPAQAVGYALAYHSALRDLSSELGVEVSARAGIHLGEVILRENAPEAVARGAKPLEVEGLAKPTAARVMSLALGGQTLLTQGAFELARRSAVGTELAEGAKAPDWVSHGAYVLKGVDTPIGIFEVGIRGVAPLSPPPDQEKAKRAGRRPLLRFAAIALTLVAAIIGGVALWDRGNGVDPAPDYSLAVLPFANMSASEDNAYFAAGMHEDVLTHLAQFADLTVISRTSVMRYAGSEKSIGEIARELRVSHVLEGSVRRAGNEVRITVQLIEAVTDGHLWAQTYDRELTDIFKVQSEVSREIASQLSLALTEEVANRIDAVPTTDLTAYDLVLRARSLIHLDSVESIATAVELLEQALERDERLAEAHASLAEALLLQSFSSVEWADVRDRALRASSRALDLDPKSATPQVVRAYILQNGEGDPDAAERHFLRALELEPKNSYALLRYAHFLLYVQSLYEEALTFIERAYLLDPLSTEVHEVLTMTLLNVDRVEDAAIVWERGVELDPDDPSMLGTGISIKTAQGDFLGMCTLTVRMIELDPTNLDYLWSPILLLSAIGELESAQLWVDRIRRLAPTHRLYFETQLPVYAASGNAEGLENLLRQWRALNSERRMDFVHDGLLTPFEVRLRGHLLFAQAAQGRASGRREEEIALRAGALAIMGDVLKDSAGNLKIISDNISLATEQAINLRILGREEEALELLEAIAGFVDPFNETNSERVVARLLLGDTEGALELAEAASPSTLKSVRENRLGLYDDMAENPQFDAFYRDFVTERRDLGAFLRREMPSFMDGTAGQ